MPTRPAPAGLPHLWQDPWMRIVSLNAWGGAMFDAFAPWLPGCGADVVCLQEVTRTPGIEGWTKFEDAERSLPQRANLFADLQQLLPSHRAYFAASDAGPVADPAGQMHLQQFGIATFVNERLTVLAEEVSFVHRSYVEAEQWSTSDRPRVAHGMRVADSEIGRTSTIVHLHGLRDPTGKGDTPARTAQSNRLAAFVSALREPDDIAIVCGDLNLLPDTEMFTVLSKIGLTDLVGLADTRTSRYPKLVRHANYMLVSDPEAVRSFHVLEQPEVSDHRPLILDL